MSRRLYLARIAAAAKAVWPPCDHRLVLLTGQSELRTSPLSTAQADFLAWLKPLPIEAVATGFPFDALASPNRRPSLLTACLQNARQYLWARNDRAYGKAAAKALLPLLISARKGVLLVTGSAGLQILQAAWPHLRRTAELRIEILALGPVGAAPRFGEAGFSAVQGSTDLWSSLLYRGPVAHRAGCGHMDYWQDPVARRALRGTAERLLAEAG